MNMLETGKQFPDFSLPNQDRKTVKLGDFAGKPEQQPLRLRDREFVEVSRENLDSVIKTIQPRLNFKIANRLGGASRELGVTLNFRKLEDFEPEQVAQQRNTS